MDRDHKMYFETTRVNADPLLCHVTHRRYHHDVIIPRFVIGHVDVVGVAVVRLCTLCEPDLFT